MTDLDLDLAIVIVSYNTRSLLADCLESVFADLNRSDLSSQVWVVDNASSDGSADMVRHRFAPVRLLAHDQNLGFAAANNLALRRMGLGSDLTPSHILFLNPDTRLCGGSLTALVEFLEANSRAGVAGAQLLYGDGSFQHSAFSFPGLAQILLDFYPVHHRLLDSRLNGRYPRGLYSAGAPFQIGHPLGAALLVRGRAMVEAVGFDERFFMYCEEIDLCSRIKAAGWQVYCVPRAKIVHLAGQSTGQFRDRMFVALWRSRFLLFEEYHGQVFQWAARRLVRLGLGSRERQARAAYRRGEIDETELENRLGAYEEVRAF